MLVSSWISDVSSTVEWARLHHAQLRVWHSLGALRIKWTVVPGMGQGGVTEKGMRGTCWGLNELIQVKCLELAWDK